jgi:hypothetical protein
MDQVESELPAKGGEKVDVSAIVLQALEQVREMEFSRKEPAYKQELAEERRKREQLERQVKELASENERSRRAAEEAERVATIKGELQKLGVQKVDLAYRAVKEDVVRATDGRLVGMTEEGELPLKQYLTSFVTDNPEFLPARIAGGSGATNSRHPQQQGPGGGFDIERIRPGMSKEEMERARQEIARVANQTLRGY